MKTTLKTLISSINDAPTGGYVGLVDYESTKGDILSCTGRIGCSYGKAKTIAIAELKQAIADKDFSDITVNGECYWDTVKLEYNARKKSMPLQTYSETFDAKEVLEIAKEILLSWENPKARKSNKVALTDKESGLHLNTETHTINFSLMVDHITYKGKTEDADTVEKKSAPETKVKAEVRKRFEKKFRDFTIAEGKFTSLKINGKTFLSENITF